MFLAYALSLHIQFIFIEAHMMDSSGAGTASIYPTSGPLVIHFFKNLCNLLSYAYRAAQYGKKKQKTNCL